MPKTFVVNVAGHVILDADEEEDAIQMAREKLSKLAQNLGPGSGFRVESATEVVSLRKK